VNTLRILWSVLVHLLVSIVREPWDFLRLVVRRVRNACELKRSRKRLPCLPLPPDIARKPDPLIYCQSYLQSLGLAVTWDNPDIQLRLGGSPVDQHDLLPDTDYAVAITVHNGSNEAPAPGVKVLLHYRRWGVAGPWIFESQGVIDLPVRGAPGEPGSLIVPWHTPHTGGHYCLLVVLVHANDLNPLNNFGQTNTDIRRNARAGERFTARFPVMHALPGRRTLRVQLTGYRLPERPLYPPAPEGAARRYDAALRRLGERPSLAGLIDAARVTGPVPLDNWTAFRDIHPSRTGKPVAIRQYAQEWLPRIVAANSPQAHPAAAAWQPAVSVHELTLDPEVEAEVELSVQVPADARRGDLQSFQVNILDDLTGLVGGVEVTVAVG